MTSVRARSVAAMTAAIVVATTVLGASCGGGPRELHVFTWANYLDRDVVAEFEQETGAKVVESNYSSNEEMRAKLQAGGGGYDLVCPSDYTVVQLVADGLLLRIESDLLRNLGNLGPRFRAPAYDPDHAHSVPFQWGVTGIGWDSAKVKTPPRSWRQFFEAAKDGRFGKVSLLDDSREVLGAALLALGRSPNSRDPADIAAARDLVSAVKANVAKFDSDDPAPSLASGETALAQGWNGMFAKGQSDTPSISFLVPAEGAFTYIDNWSVPTGARNPALAHAFIDFCLRPDVAAKLVTRKLYPSCNEAAKATIPAEILAGTCYADGGGAALFWVEDAGSAGDLYGAAWAAIKSE